MQPINSDLSYLSISNSVNERWDQTIDLEKAQDEIELLREQVSFLQQYLSEQTGQQQLVEQELHYTKQELELMDAEIQHLVESELLIFKEIKKFIRAFSADEENSKKILVRLFSKVYGETVFSEELEPVRSILSSKDYKS